MERIVLEPSTDTLRDSPIHQLTSVEELMIWERWNNTHCGHPLSPDHERRKYKFYEEILTSTGSVGSGADYLDPAIFAIFNEGNIVAAGSIVIKKCFEPSYYLPAGSHYAFTTDAYTESAYRGLGLNTQITRARIDWARRAELPLVVTRVKLVKPASIQAKLKAGFFVDSYEDNYLTLLKPLKAPITVRSGLPLDTPNQIGEEVPLSHLSPDSFADNFGSVSFTPRIGQGVYIRMLPRVFSAPREM